MTSGLVIFGRELIARAKKDYVGGLTETKAPAHIGSMGKT